MDVTKGEQTLEKYNLKTGNRFASIIAVANDVRKHQADNNYIPTISESLSFIVEGKEPESIKDYVAFYERVDTVIDEDLDGVLEDIVKEYVRKSIQKSLKRHKLTFVYPYNDDGLCPKIRIHCKQVWNKLGFKG
jgi:hypothetical protein